MLLEEMSWPEIALALKKSRTIITEEDGPHLPVFTDTVEVAKRPQKGLGFW